MMATGFGANDKPSLSQMQLVNMSIMTYSWQHEQTA